MQSHNLHLLSPLSHVTHSTEHNDTDALILRIKEAPNRQVLKLIFNKLNKPQSTEILLSVFINKDVDFLNKIKEFNGVAFFIGNGEIINNLLMEDTFYLLEDDDFIKKFYMTFKEDFIFTQFFNILLLAYRHDEDLGEYSDYQILYQPGYQALIAVATTDIFYHYQKTAINEYQLLILLVHQIKGLTPEHARIAKTCFKGLSFHNQKVIESFFETTIPFMDLSSFRVAIENDYISFKCYDLLTAKNLVDILLSRLDDPYLKEKLTLFVDKTEIFEEQQHVFHIKRLISTRLQAPEYEPIKALLEEKINTD